jgi:hypothetical protein
MSEETWEAIEMRKTSKLSKTSVKLDNKTQLYKHITQKWRKN